MECPNCKTDNPNENRFCGACSSPLTEEIVDIQAFIRDEFPRQIERAVDAKLLALADREVIEVKATENVINRVWTWATRFATVLGIPVVAVVSILGFFGLSTIEDIDDVHSELTKLHEEAKIFQENTSKNASIMLAEISKKVIGADIRFASIDSKMAIANDTIKKINDTEKKMNELLADLPIQLTHVHELFFFG